MTDKQKELRPCPFCGKAFTRPINNMDIYTCNHCIHWSDHLKSPGITGFTLSRAYCWKRIDELEKEIKELKTPKTFTELISQFKELEGPFVGDLYKKIAELTQLLGKEEK